MTATPKNPRTEAPLFPLMDILADDVPEIAILDIGAMIEGEARYQPLLDQRRTRLTLVEPDRTEAARIKAEMGDGVRLIEAFLGDGKPATLYRTRYPGCASLFEPDPAVINQFMSIDTTGESNFAVAEEVPVDTLRLDDLDPPVRADLIKIDVQGSELVILENGAECLAKALVVEAEAEFLPLYRNQPLFGDLQAFLRGQGFQLHKLIDVGSRCYRPIYFDNNIHAGMSQMLWADAVFVRDTANLGSYSAEALLTAARVLNDLYGSFDLVYFLLSEHDRRSGGGLARAYSAKLAGYPNLPKRLLNLKEMI